MNPGAAEINDNIDQNCVNDAPTVSAPNVTINEDGSDIVTISINDVDDAISCTDDVSFTSSNT